jgi:hypothetical protein
MKKFCSTTAIAVFLLLISIGIKAQTAQTKLNQVELMKQFIGTWKSDWGDGNAMILEYTPYGNGIVGNAKIESKETALDNKKYFFGYDEKNDKIIITMLHHNAPIIEITANWFISKDIMNSVPYQDISNPENANMKWKFEFKSPDKFVITSLQNNIVKSVDEWTREKK